MVTVPVPATLAYAESDSRRPGMLLLRLSLRLTGCHRHVHWQTVTSESKKPAPQCRGASTRLS
jgi:hypothetical protein